MAMQTSSTPVSVLLDTTRATSLRDNNTITTHEPVNLIIYVSQSHMAISILHSWKLQRWSPSSLEHPINKHPVFSETSKIEFPRASAIFPRSEYFEVPSGDEARVPHTDVHRTLRRVPPDGDRPFLHQILEFSALKPGYSRPRHPAYHRHLQRYLVEFWRCVLSGNVWAVAGNWRGDIFLVLWKRGIQFYTVENLARNVPDRGHSGSDPPPRRRGKREALANQKRPNGRKYCDRQSLQPIENLSV